MSKSDFIVIDAKNEMKKREILDRKIEVLYLNAFVREVTRLQNNSAWKNDRETIKKTVFYALKYYGMNRVMRKYDNESLTSEQVKRDFSLLEYVKVIMSQLTPRKIMSIFPITKTYDGDKWGYKDYFYTIEELKNYDLDISLGTEQLEDFLWDYYNRDLFKFSSTSFSIISNMYRLQNGGRGIMEEWAAKNGLTTYTVNKEKGYIVNNSTGEIGSLKSELEFTVIK